MPETDEKLLKKRVQWMLDHCELSNVRVLEFSAKRSDNHREPATVQIATDTSYLVNENAFLNRYTWNVDLVDGSDSPVAELNATLLVEYDVREGFEPDTEAADTIASSTGFFAAYPYVRELFQSCAARLQIDPIVLGMLFAGSTRPRGVTITRTSVYEHDDAISAENVSELHADQGSSGA